jgi:hypothetical protein
MMAGSTGVSGLIKPVSQTVRLDDKNCQPLLTAFVDDKRRSMVRYQDPDHVDIVSG